MKDPTRLKLIWILRTINLIYIKTFFSNAGQKKRENHYKMFWDTSQ